MGCGVSSGIVERGGKVTRGLLVTGDGGRCGSGLTGGETEELLRTPGPPCENASRFFLLKTLGTTVGSLEGNFGTGGCVVVGESGPSSGGGELYFSVSCLTEVFLAIFCPVIGLLSKAGGVLETGGLRGALTSCLLSKFFIMFDILFVFGTTAGLLPIEGLLVTAGLLLTDDGFSNKDGFLPREGFSPSVGFAPKDGFSSRGFGGNSSGFNLREEDSEAGSGLAFPPLFLRSEGLTIGGGED